MQITINTAEALSDTDLAILAVLVQQDAAATPAPKAEKAAAKPAKKAAAKPEPKPEPEPEPEEDEDLVGGDDAPTMEDAVALATKLVSSGRSKDVKAALNAAGAKRVSELKAEDIPEFVNALS